MKKIISIMLIVTVFTFIFNYLPSLSFAETKKEFIAVLDFDFKGGVAKDEASIITDRFRAHLVSTGKFDVMERSHMDKILKEQGFQQSGYCSSTECSVKIGQLLSVNRIIVGSVSKVGSTYSINVRFIDVETGKILKEEFEDCKCSIDDVFTKITKNVALKLINVSSLITITPDIKKMNLLKAYKDNEKWWGIAMGLNVLPIEPGYIYLDEWGWWWSLMALEALGIGFAAINSSSSIGLAGAAVTAGAYLFGIIHAPILANAKNADLMKKLDITEEDIKNFMSMSESMDFYSVNSPDGLYMNLGKENFGLIYRLNF